MYEYRTLLAQFVADGDEISLCLIDDTGLSNELEHYGAQGWRLVSLERDMYRYGVDIMERKIAILERAAPKLFGVKNTKGQWMQNGDGSVFSGSKRELAAWIELNKEMYGDSGYTIHELPSGDKG